MGMGLAFALVVFVAALVLAPISNAQSTDDGESIEWAQMTGIRVGDFWRFQLSGTEQGWVHNEVETIGPFTSLLRGQYTALKVHVIGEITSSSSPTGAIPTELDGNKWVNQSDLASIQVDGVTSVEDANTRELNQTYDPPLIDVVYPFTTGYEWYTESLWTRQQGGDSSAVAIADQKLIKWRAKVAGQETLSVPAGTFDAWRLDYTQSDDDGSVRAFSRWYVADVCDMAKEVHYDAEGDTIRTMVLTSYKCAADEVEQPTYDPDDVHLLSRGHAGGPKGPVPDDIPPDPDSVPREKETAEASRDDDRETEAISWPIAVSASVAAALTATALLFARRR